MDFKISRNFTMNEFIKSDMARMNNISIDPTPEQICAITALTLELLQPIRDNLRKPLIITSGLRNADLNHLVGGAENSQHLKGEAADIAVDGQALEIVKAILQEFLVPDQCICYKKKNIVHVSYNRFGKNRGQFIYK